MELLPLLCPDRTDRLTLMEGGKLWIPMRQFLLACMRGVL